MLYNRIKSQALPRNNALPDPEVAEKAKRRSFTSEYKQRILEKVAKCTEPGQVGELLRREGLYSSHLTTWRRQRQTGGLAGLSAKQRGPKKDESAAELARLQRENERLRRQLEQAELIIAAQKKLAQALEALTDSNDSS
jgi:transposase-like protein